ncbi:M20/M25/M40 family metallo-hydrolase [Reinekea blandensis]|uniref:Predicted aminopeptidase n=1 Tax=Reinekea blandensis MED297 TaxID=314283 RepID=A4BH05_9GAMM|nr:M20/M25/M40 family metallo-hydrolase [Reinekea blandensis]EAR08651.1 predicted aminopeptidase [Reinekea sp. MED297] [Reinekea blandensis MED297]
MRVSISAALLGLTLSHAAQADDIWISMGADGYESLKDHYPALIQKQAPLPATLLTEDSQAINLIQVNEKHLSIISEMMHHEHNRCGGFIAHDSLMSAQDELAQSQILMNQGLTLESLVAGYSLDNAPVVNALQQAMTEPGIRGIIEDLQAFTNRYYTSTHGENSAIWLRDEWSAIAAGRDDITVTLYDHSWPQSSVVMTIEGRTTPNEYVVLGAHLDSIISGGMSNNTRAPGADDDASGIATLTELIRAITSTDFKPNRTLTLIGYAAEEVGLRGSKDIAQDYRNSGKNVVGVLQLDMTNYQGSSQDIYIIDDYTNAAQNDFVEDLVVTYQPSLSVSRTTCGYACSDHASWTNQGFAATFPFEATFSGANPYIHSSGDTLDKSGNNAFHALKFGKLAAAYVAELAKGNMSDTPPDPDPGEDVTDTFTGSVGRNEEARFGPLSVAGQSTVSITMTGTNDADLYVRVGAEPTTSAYDCRPYQNGSAEQCSVTIGNSDADVYLMARGYSQSTSSFTINATYTPGDSSPPPTPTTETFSDSVGRNQEDTYGPFSIVGGSDFSAAITGTNDADLYVRFGSAPTTSSYDCRPYKNGSSESCELTAAASDTSAYVMVRGYSSSTSNYDLTVEYLPQQ